MYTEEDKGIHELKRKTGPGRLRKKREKKRETMDKTTLRYYPLNLHKLVTSGITVWQGTCCYQVTSLLSYIV